MQLHQDSRNKAHSGSSVLEILGVRTTVDTTGKQPRFANLYLENVVGHKEWAGDWSAKSQQWTRRLQRELGNTVSPTFGQSLATDQTSPKTMAMCCVYVLCGYYFPQVANDGTFWMAFDDFLAHFTDIEVAKCHESWEATNIGPLKINPGSFLNRPSLLPVYLHNCTMELSTIPVAPSLDYFALQVISLPQARSMPTR